jgi:hypothetical protein
MPTTLRVEGMPRALSIYRLQLPIRDDHLGPGRHIAHLAGDLDLLALGGLGQLLLKMRKLLAALAAALNFFLAFADGHGQVSGVGCRVSGVGFQSKHLL